MRSLKPLACVLCTLLVAFVGRRPADGSSYLVIGQTPMFDLDLLPKTFVEEWKCSMLQEQGVDCGSNQGFPGQPSADRSVENGPAGERNSNAIHLPQSTAHSASAVHKSVGTSGDGKLELTRWPDGVVLYGFGDEFSQNEEDFILGVLGNYHQGTDCVRFEYRPVETNFVQFRKAAKDADDDGCSLRIGCEQEEPQVITLGSGCWSTPKILEIVDLAIGFERPVNPPGRRDWREEDRSVLLDGRQDDESYICPELKPIALPAECLPTTTTSITTTEEPETTMTTTITTTEEPETTTAEPETTTVEPETTTEEQETTTKEQETTTEEQETTTAEPETTTEEQETTTEEVTTEKPATTEEPETTTEEEVTTTVEPETTTTIPTTTEAVIVATTTSPTDEVTSTTTPAPTTSVTEAPTPTTSTLSPLEELLFDNCVNFQQDTGIGTCWSINDPYNCHRFIQCANNIPNFQDCPLDLLFDPVKCRCEYPSEAMCLHNVTLAWCNACQENELDVVEHVDLYPK